MALILSIETSTSDCSVALHRDGILMSSSHLPDNQKAAAYLTVMIADMLRSANISMKDLCAVAVSSGPGSYTGLRIGVSAAKGICYGLQVPLLAVGSLHVLALQASPGFDLICPMIDARRMEVYCCLFDKNLEEVMPVQAKVIDMNSFRDELNSSHILFLGNGASKCKDVLQHPNSHFSDSKLIGASAMGAEAWRKYNLKQWEDLTGFEPFYLKEFVAKTKLI